MTPNEIISDKRGECRHPMRRGPWTSDHGDNEYECCLCRVKFAKSYGNTPTDYETDPGAWSPELFEWIEGEGMDYAFIDYLTCIMTGYSCDRSPINGKSMFALFKSTPQQKALALARAIEEER